MSRVAIILQLEIESPNRDASRRRHRAADCAQAGGAAGGSGVVARGARGSQRHQPGHAVAARAGGAESDGRDARRPLRRLRLDAVAADGGGGDQARELRARERAGGLEGSRQRLPAPGRLAAGARAARGDGGRTHAGGGLGLVRVGPDRRPRASPLHARGIADARGRRHGPSAARRRLPALHPWRADALPRHRQTRGALRHRDRAPMSDATGIHVDEWHPDPDGSPGLARDLDMLAEVLHAVVHTGAGVSFVVPFSLGEARAFWTEKVLPGVRAHTRRVVVARAAGARIVGTVQIDLATPPNQPHRAEVAKLLVHPGARRRGIARALMVALEALAAASGRTLLTLDTWTDGHAERLYRSL